MAGDIKGITIEFRGNATPLQKAIRQVDSELKSTTRELTNINKALKFNPTSVDLWRQKQQLLKQKVDETTEKLDALKAAQKQMDAAGVDKTSAEYRKLQREIIETGSQLKTFKSQLNGIGNVNLRALGESFKQAGAKIESAGQSMRGLSTAAGVAAGAIGALTVKSAAWADDLNTLSKRYSMSTNDLQKYGAAANLVDTSVDAIANSHVRLEKNMLSASNGSKAQAEAFEKLGVEYKNADGSLREGDKVWQDTITALGQMTNETERDALAMQLMGKSANELNPLIEDGGETYKQLSETLAKYNLDFIDQETLDKANQFNDELDTIKAIGLVAFQSIGTELAGYLAPALEKVVAAVGHFAQWLSSLDPAILAVITAITGLVAILAPVLITIGKISTGIGAIISLVGVIGPAIGGVISTLLPFIAIGAMVVAAGVAIYKNWDQIKANAQEFAAKVAGVWNSVKGAVSAGVNAVISKFNQLKSRVQAIWNSVRDAITKPIQTAVNLVKTAINKIKSIINGAKLSLPHFKLPHFKINGGTLPWGIGGKGSPPKISVSWYRKAEEDPYMFRSATLFGAGEHNDEMLYGHSALMEDIRAATGGGPQITFNITINGADNPEEWGRRLVRQMQQEMRTT